MLTPCFRFVKWETVTALFLFKILITFLPNSAIFGWANISKLTFCRRFWWLPTYFSLKPTLTFLLSDFEAAFDPAMYVTAQPANPSTLKQVALSIAWSLKIFLHLKWTSDQENCVAKFEKKNCQEIFISSEHLIFWPGWLACLDILSPAPNIHPSRLILLLTRAFRALWPSELGIIYIYTHG